MTDMTVSIDHPTNRPNFTVVQVGSLSIWFSYRTAIAFQSGYQGIVVRENDWGATTGKHLNYVDGGGKGTRVSGREFESMLAKVVPEMEAV